ncbi:hypothetical protein N0V95_005287 [Ascochyta clinopodiicola]|nr:hypothetical protein N0V95_005287 [Ascochyta clinopodiicola]
MDHRNGGHIGAASGDVVSKVEMEVDSEAKDRWRELKAAKTEEEEIERYKRQQARMHTKAEAAHNEELHKSRLRMIQARKAGREAEQKAAQTQEAAHELTLKADWSAKQDAYKQAKRIGNEEGTGAKRFKESPAPISTASSAAHPTSDTDKIKHVFLDVRGDRVASSTLKRPNLERTDSAVLPDEDQQQNPPPSTLWRNTKRQRDSLNVDLSRIHTHFIFSDEFIDDVNIMLDFVAGWPRDLFKDIRSSFEKDSENQDRRIKFARSSDDEWAVHILKPASLASERRNDPADLYTLDDLPDNCREYGCIEGCPRKISMEEQIADLKNFREDQNNKGPPNILKETYNPVGPSLKLRFERRAMPPPPILPRPRKRRVPHEAEHLEIMPTQPSGSSMQAYDIEQLQQKNIHLENEIKQLKMLLSQPFDGKSVENIQGWLQNNPVSDAGTGAPQSSRKDSLIGKPDSGPLGGKLAHTDKIPSGLDSVRVEEYMLTSAFDKRSKIPELRDEGIRNRPRKDYYAERPPTKSDLKSKVSTTLPSQEVKQSPSDTAAWPSSTTTPRIMFRPQYERSPEAH